MEKIVSGDVPGVYARISDERGTWTTRAGVGDLESGRPMPHNGTFRAASMTKSLVATVVLQLVEEHRLRLDDPVDRWLPGLVRGGENITVRQLLNHTAGTGDYTSDSLFDHPNNYIDEHFTPRQLLDIAAEQPSPGDPGAQWSYSNTGYIALGMIVERATGRRLPDVLESRVLDPAGMRDSYLPVRKRGLRGPNPSGYFLAADGDITEVTRLDPSFAWAAYGLVSTPRDIDRFYDALWSGQLLRERSLDRMTTTVATGKRYFPGYGLGLESVRLTCSEPGLGHTGSMPGFSSFAFSSADGERQVVITINAQIRGSQAGQAIFAALNAINLEFCGETLPPPSGEPRLQDAATR